MKGSVIYQDILQQGKRLGRREGQREGEIKLILRLLTRRFGEVESSLLERVRDLSIEQLEALAEALLDFTKITDLVTWLEQQENSQIDNGQWTIINSDINCPLRLFV